MTSDLRDTQDDLAFIRALVTDTPRTQASGGWLFMAGGGLYCLTAGLALLLFMALPGWIMIRQAARKAV
ncbi:hypothetical protein [Caulobacter sp. DWR1-3-2b1]|uniref:hypothetical protein n=1 Tax=Caulobacter sp. DWR1-3-2b1 TaxID=2804670 RepID=UPI003CE8C1C9